MEGASGLGDGQRDDVAGLGSAALGARERAGGCDADPMERNLVVPNAAEANAMLAKVAQESARLNASTSQRWSLDRLADEVRVVDPEVDGGREHDGVGRRRCGFAARLAAELERRGVVLEADGGRIGVAELRRFGHMTSMSTVRTPT